MADKKEAQSLGAVNITIRGQSFSVPNKYAEGHVLTANEASVLNQTRRENIRNNCAAAVKAFESSEIDEAAMKKRVGSYIDSYEFGQVTGGGNRLSDVEREARIIARRSVMAAIKKDPSVVADLDAKEKAEQVKEWVAQFEKDPSILKEAAEEVARIEARPVRTLKRG